MDLIAINNQNANSKSVNFLHGNGDGTFKTPVATTNTANLSGVVAGDFNRDGKLDIAVTDSVQNTVSVLVGNGDGTFQAAVSYAAESQPMAVTAADLNKDGKLDLIVANMASGSVSVLLANGDGTFQTAMNFSVGAADPVSVTVGDFNADGNLDVAVAINSNRYAVLKGNGDGTLQPGQAQIIFNTPNPSGIAAGDVNGDGKLDLIVVTDSVQVLLGNGNLTFQRPVAYKADLRPSAVMLVDVNGDNHLDIVVTNWFSNSLSTLVNRGDGSFSAPSTYAVETLPVALTAGDFNEDGRPDIAVADNGAGPTNGAISVVLGNGDGTFRAAAAYQVNRPGFGEGPGAFVAADFNGDGRADLATLTSGGAVAILLSAPDSSLQRGATYTVGNAADLAIGDVNKDGKLDLVVAGYTDLTVLLGNGDGTFQPQSPEPLPPPQSTSQNLDHRAALGDFNGDGKLDLVITNLTSTFSDVSIMLGNGDGTFQSPVNYNSGEGPLAVVVADFNRDGKMDFAVANAGGGRPELPGSVAIFLGNGDGSFTRNGPYTGGVTPYSLVAADFNNDDKLDLAMANSGNSSAGSVSVFIGTGAGLFASAVNYPFTIGLSSIVAADFTGDGLVDLAVSGSSEDSVTMLTNAGNGAFQFGPKSFSGSGNLYALDLNGDAAPDIVAESTGFVLLLNTGGSSATLTSSFNPSGFQQNVTFTASIIPSVRGSGTPSGTVSFKDGAIVLGTSALDSTGRATFSTLSLSRGFHTVTASYAGDAAFNPKIAPSLTQLVKLASSTALSSSTSSVVLGKSITLTVTVSGTPNLPTGTVIFAEGSSVLGSATLDSSGNASLTIPNLTGGSHLFSAVYQGDNLFAGSTSAAVVVAVQDFLLAVSPNSANLRAGQSATFNITTTSLAGLNGDVSFGCSGLPALANCSFNPTTVTVNGSSATTVLTITTTGTAALLPAPFDGNGVLYAFALLFGPIGCGLLLMWTGSSRPRRAIRTMLVLSCMSFVIACGGGSGNNGGNNGGNTPLPSTPAGSNTIMVSAISTVNGTTVTHQIPINVTVTP